jgi:hypothetical protein
VPSPLHDCGGLHFARRGAQDAFGSVTRGRVALITGAMPSVLVRVRAVDADPADPGVEVELPVTPGGWGSEHTERVANAVGVDTHSALVSLRFADGESEGLPAGRGGWRMITAMESGDVLIVGSGAAAAAAATPPAVVPSAVMGGGGNTPRVRVTGHEPLPQEQLNYKRLSALLISEPAEIRKALQEVRVHHSQFPSPHDCTCSHACK